MSKYIDLDKVIDKLEDEWGYEGMREDLYELPTADVEEVRHGEWLENGANYKCSRCGNTESYYTDSYCRVCGARMDGGKEE